MNILRSQVLDEITHLDIKSLIVLQNLLPSLKRAAPLSRNKVGIGAKQASKALNNISTDLSQAITDGREDRI